MRKIALYFAFTFLGTTADVAVYVKICSLYGNSFFYIPGTDVCLNPTNGDTRVQTPHGTVRTLSPMANDIATLQGQSADLYDKTADLYNQTADLQRAQADLQRAQQAMQARFDADFRDAIDGSAIAMALDSPYLTNSEHFGIKVNWGNYLNANAVGVTFAGVLAETAGSRLTLSGGVAFTGSNLGGHAGLQFSW